jgi:hypothetical protein
VFRKGKALGYTTKNSWILIPPFERHGAFGEWTVEKWTRQGTPNKGRLEHHQHKLPAPGSSAALPLFACGLGGLGLLGWRRKQKAQAVA